MMPSFTNLGRKCWWTGPDGVMEVGEIKDIYVNFYLVEWVDKYGQPFHRHVKPANIIFA